MFSNIILLIIQLLSSPYCSLHIQQKQNQAKNKSLEKKIIFSVSSDLIKKDFFFKRISRLFIREKLRAQKNKFTFI